jgi:hypothetical protein
MKKCIHIYFGQPPQKSQNSDFQSHFSMLKIDWIFSIKKSLKNIGLGDQLLLVLFSENLPNFFSSVHNFGRSDNDMI